MVRCRAEHSRRRDSSERRKRTAHLRPSPGIGFGSGPPWAWEQFIELFQCICREGQLQTSYRAIELIDGTGADNRSGDGRLVKQPCERHIGRLFTQLPAELFVTLQARAIFRNVFPDVFVRAPPDLCWLQGAGEQSTREGAPRDQA